MSAFTDFSSTMASKSRFFGLRGFKLNLAVGVLAGLNFLLFGYDQGVMGGLLTLPSFYNVFPEIDTTSARYKSLSVSAQNHQSTVQGLSERFVPFSVLYARPLTKPQELLLLLTTSVA